MRRPVAARPRTPSAAQRVTARRLDGGLAPPLAGKDFDAIWSGRPLWDLVSKIQNTMPARRSRQAHCDAGRRHRGCTFCERLAFQPGEPSSVAQQEALKDLAFPASAVKTTIAPVASHASSFPPVGNMAELMRGVLFPSSNLIFNVQTIDPDEVNQAGRRRCGSDDRFLVG